MVIGMLKAILGYLVFAWFQHCTVRNGLNVFKDL